MLQETAAQPSNRNVQKPKDTWSNSDYEAVAEGDSDFTGPESNPPPRRSTPGPTATTPPSAYKASNAEISARGDGNTRVRTSIGRKPSGARVRPGSGLVRLPEFDTPPSAVSPDQMDERSELPYDDTVNALAALDFLESQGFDVSSQQGQPLSRSIVPTAESAPQSVSTRGSSSPAPSNETPQFRSSFALSKQAAERHAKVQAQQDARHQPGKPKANGGPKTRKASGAWMESSEEEEEDDDDDDDEASDVEPSARPTGNKQPVPEFRASVYPSAQPNASKEGLAQNRFLPQTPNSGGMIAAFVSEFI